MRPAEQLPDAPMKKVECIFLVLLLVGAFAMRAPMFPVKGGDFKVYEGSVQEVFAGEDIYAHSERSFKMPREKHWFANLPAGLYLNMIAYRVAECVPGLRFVVAMKIPVLLADFGIALLLFRILRRKAGSFESFGAVAVWLFNPHLMVMRNYTHFDPLPSFFVLLSLYLMENSPYRSSAYLGVAVTFKAYGMILAPYYLRVMPKRTAFIACFLGVIGAVALPFLFWNPGALLYTVFLARPGLGFSGMSVPAMINKALSISIPSFTGLAVLSVLCFILFIRKRQLAPYAYASLMLGTFLVVTPVLHKTYPLWFLPPYLVWAGMFSHARQRGGPFVFAGLAGGVYILYAAWLSLHG